MAPVLREWVPDGDLAHFVSDLVDGGALDLSAIYADYTGERGFPPYDPRLMVKLLVYGYANGVMSSRKLERATYRDVAVRMLCADQHPDFRSIGRFRKRHLHALGELFVQALRLCRQAGLVGLAVAPRRLEPAVPGQLGNQDQVAAARHQVGHARGLSTCAESSYTRPLASATAATCSAGGHYATWAVFDRP